MSMGNEISLNDLATDIAGTAFWRHQKADEFPQDDRNLAAALLLDRLACEIRALGEDTPVVSQWKQVSDQLQRRIEADKNYEFSDLSLECSEYLRRIGFSEFRNSGAQYLMQLREIYQDWMAHAEKSSVEAAAGSNNELLPVPPFIVEAHGSMAPQSLGPSQAVTAIACTRNFARALSASAVPYIFSGAASTWR